MSTRPAAPSSLSPHQRHFVRLAQYNTWFNGELFGHASSLGETERKRDRGAFFGSIHDTLDHVLLCDRSWLGRVRKSSLRFSSLEDADLVENLTDLRAGVTQDWDELVEFRRETDIVLERFVDKLTPDLLASDLEYRNSKGIPFAQPLWHVVAHVFNHGTHHRGQVTTLLMQAGVDPGPTDFLITAMMPFPGAD
ncbi:MAG: DinB family protein [bacterium]|nr:DinB family protein [bacterium]